MVERRADLQQVIAAVAKLCPCFEAKSFCEQLCCKMVSSPTRPRRHCGVASAYSSAMVGPTTILLSTSIKNWKGCLTHFQMALQPLHVSKGHCCPYIFFKCHLYFCCLSCMYCVSWVVSAILLQFRVTRDTAEAPCWVKTPASWTAVHGCIKSLIPPWNGRAFATFTMYYRGLGREGRAFVP